MELASPSTPFLANTGKLPAAHKEKRLRVREVCITTMAVLAKQAKKAFTALQYRRKKG
jgi:hypothetical protein